MARSTRAIKKRLVKPTHADAEILLRLVELGQSERMLKAENWLWNELSAKDFQEFQRQYPEGSEGYNYCMTISSFWETVGVLLYYKLINENLLFDRFVVEPYWERLEFIFQGIREAYKELDIAENFEWLAKMAAKWDKSHKPKI
jgi:hypothetical protein